MTATITKSESPATTAESPAQAPRRPLTEAEWQEKWGISLTREPQAFSGLPDEAYRQLPGYNASLLKKVVEKTLYHTWRDELDPNRPPREEKDVFTVGSIFHCRLNEPEELERRFVVVPEDMPSRPTQKQLTKPKAKKDGTWNESSTAYQNWVKYCENEKTWVDFLAKNEGKEIVTQKQLDEGISQAEAILRHPVLAPRYENTPENRRGNELTLTYIDPQTGERCKVRIDALRIIGNTLWIGDTKGAQDASPGPDGFGRAAAKFGYVLQASFYFDGVFYCQRAIEKIFDLPDGSLIPLRKEFEFIAVEKYLPAPETIGRYIISDENIAFTENGLNSASLLSWGRRLYRKALNNLVSATKMKYFPGYSTAAVELQIPPYAYRQWQDYLGDAEE